LAVASSSGAGVGGRRQRGMGLISWLLLLVLAALVALLGLRVAPVYLESMTVRSVVSDVARDPELRGARPSDVRSAVMRRLQVNNVSSVERGDITVERSGDGIELIVDYERRFRLLANLDGVASFREEAMVDP